MSIYFILRLKIYVMIGSTNDICYFILKMFVIMRNTMFDVL